MRPEVMVLSAASGDGHVRAAEAIVPALRALELEGSHLEVLQHTAPLLRRLYAEAYVETVNRRSWLLGFAYDSMNRAGRFQTARLWFDLAQCQRLIRLLARRRPRALLCTHFLPAEIAAHLRRRRALDARIGIVVTDFDFHPLWLYRDVDWYFVAGEEARARLRGFGVANEAIRVTGIPVAAAFGSSEDKLEARSRLGLRAELATVLVSAGGFGMGPVDAVIEGLQRVERPLQIAVVCGRNEALQSRLRGLAPGRHPITVVGYTDAMHSWMAAADLLVGKAGGLTSAEAMARGLVPIIVNPIPGPEERNAAILARRGVALWCRTVEALPREIDLLLGDPRRLGEMRQAVATFAAPAAAASIASVIAGSIGSSPGRAPCAG